MKRTSRSTGYNFWPCVSDLMLATFVFVLFLWLVGQASIARLNARVEQDHPTPTPIPTPTPVPPATPTPPPVDPRAYAQATKEIEKLTHELALLRERAPKVDLAEAKGFSFDPGTVNLSNQANENFEHAVVEPLRALLEQYGNYVDTIEIIGYTDEKPVALHAGSDLDSLLLDTLTERMALDKLRFGSNADLGLLRALAISQRLRKIQQQGGLRTLPVRVYSAAQINPPELPRPIDPKALRRMEIRLTRLKEAARPPSSSGR